MAFIRRGIDWGTQGAYRRAIAAERGLGRRAFARVRTAEVAAEMEGKRSAALGVLNAMRKDPKLSLTVAAKKKGVTPTLVRSLLGEEGFTKQAGRYRATEFDSIGRRFTVVLPDGTYGERTIVGNRGASLYGSYLNAVRKFLRTGDTAVVLYDGKTVETTEGPFQLVTDPSVLRQLARTRTGEARRRWGSW